MGKERSPLVAINTEVRTRKKNRFQMTLAVVLLMLALSLGIFAMPSIHGDAAAAKLKVVDSCKDLVVKQYDKKNNIWILDQEQCIIECKKEKTMLLGNNDAKAYKELMNRLRIRPIVIRK